MSNCLLLLFYSIVYILLLFIIMLIIIVIMINYHRKIVQDSCNLTKVPLFTFSHCVNRGLTLVRLGFMITNTVMNNLPYLSTFLEMHELPNLNSCTSILGLLVLRICYNFGQIKQNSFYNKGTVK